MAIPDAIIAIEAWAKDGDRQTPEQAGLVRADGFPASYSLTDTPSRQLINQLLYEVSLGVKSLREAGIFPWDARIDYKAGAVAVAGDALWIATEATGPGTGNAVDPTADAQTIWSKVQPSIAVPEAPDGLAGAAGSGEIVWSWQCAKDNGAVITQFEIQVRRAGSSWPVSGDIVTATSHTTRGAVNGAGYEARVRARNSVGWGEYSEIAVATPQATAPGRIIGLALAPGDAEIGVVFEQPDDGGSPIIRYETQWRADEASFATSRQQTHAGVSATLTGLNNGTPYHVRSRAVNARGNGAWSAEKSATPAADVPDQARPDAPGTPVGAAGNRTIRWSWPVPRDNGARITSFLFQQRRQGQSWPSQSVTLNVACRDSGTLTNGQTYEARVKAVNSVGESDWSSVGSATPAAEVPDQIQRVELDVGDRSLTVRWGTPADNGDAIDDYRVEWATSSSFASAQAAVLTATSRVLSNLVNGRTYYVRVRARNGAGDGAWSPTATAIPSSGRARPGAPEALRGVALRGAIRWEWGAARENGDSIDRYELQWRRQGQSWSGNVVQLTRGCAVVEGLTGGTTYEARVRAVNSEGAGAWSGTATQTTLALIPQKISLVASNAAYRWPYSDVPHAVLRMVSDTEVGGRAVAIDIDLGNGDWRGGTSDGSDIWVADQFNGVLRVWDAATRTRASGRDISGWGGGLQGAIYGDGIIWGVLDASSLNRLRPYDVAARSFRSSSQNISLPNRSWHGGAYKDGKLYLVDGTNNDVIVYSTSGTAIPAESIDLGNGDWRGAFIVGDLLYVVDDSSNYARAWRVSDGARVASADISLEAGVWQGGLNSGRAIYLVDNDSDYLRGWSLTPPTSITIDGVTYRGQPELWQPVTGLSENELMPVVVGGSDGVIDIYPQAS